MWLLALPWNGEMNITGALGGTMMLALVQLLGEAEISGTLIDMMAACLSRCIEEEPDCTTVIEQLQFMHDIEKAESANHHSVPLTKFLKQLEEQFKGGISCTLYFPAHFKKNKHWVSLICLHCLTGDSLSMSRMPPPTEIICKVQCWLEGWFNGPFKNIGDTLLHGHQHDSTSCGMCTINMTAHNALGDPLWTTS